MPQNSSDETAPWPYVPPPHAPPRTAKTGHACHKAPRTIFAAIMAFWGEGWQMLNRHSFQNLQGGRLF